MASVLVCDGQLSYNSSSRPACQYADGTNAWQTVPDQAIFVAELFDMPSQADLEQAFIIPFTFLMLLHVSAWLYGKVIEFVESKTHHS